MSEDLSFPIGKFKSPPSLTDAEWQAAINTMASQPARFRSALKGLSEAQLDSPYRPGGWTVRQRAHHVPDSHMNMYMRFKVALTEDNPTIKPYDQDAWSTLADVRAVPISTSLLLFDALHERAISVLRSVSVADRARKYVHPENGPTRIDQMVALYAWHGDHHIAHVLNLRKREGW
ncbi:MAG: YfiT family bacillithiol transferase [Gemmatimonadaceae bacterium]